MDARNERRVVTALFIDVVGSTNLMMRVGPELMKRRLVDAFSQISARIAEYGGTVESYAGDSVFAIFGAPNARVDDPERAVRAGQACAEWAATADAVGGERLSVRAGIETGEALVDMEAVARHERMAIGPCVNIAARLQQDANPGEILVGPAAHGATAHVATYDDLGPLDLRGLGTVNGWRFVGFESAVEVPSVPFVGRELEMRTLIEAAERSARGEQMLALVVGAPGLGKSRLVEEVIRARQGTTGVIMLRCRPTGEDGSNTPLRQLVEADVPNATPDAVRARLAALLGADAASPVATAVLHSAGLEASPELLAINRYEQRVNIAEAWRRYLTALAAERPLILAVEDVHWGDPVLVFMLYHATSGGSAPLLIAATARPEFAGSPLIRAGDNQLKIELAPLDASVADELARATRGRVAGLDRAAGNPLFIIELARAQSGAALSADLPLTIQSAIAARLDELSQDERQLLQQVSIAGETFDVRDAALLSDRQPVEVAGMLGRIAHLGFVEFSGRAYRFHHAMVRDVAYSRLPVTNRLHLHARYADEGVVPGDVIARAFHLWESVKPPDAAWVWEDAGRLAALRLAAFDAQLLAGRLLETWNQYEQAEEVFTHAVELAGTAQQRAEALAELGRAQVRQGKGDEAWANRLASLEAYAEAGTPAPARLYADMLEVTAFNWGYFHDLPTDELVGRLVEQGLAVARASDDQVSLARLIMERAAFAGDAGDADEVLGLLDSDDPVRFAEPGHRLAQVLMWNGEFSRSLELYGRVFNELLPRGAAINEPEAMTWYALAAFFSGDLHLAMALRDRGATDLAKGRSVHTRSHVLGISSLLALGRGDWAGLLGVTSEIEAMLAEHPHDSFCLIGGSSVGFGGTARLLAGKELPNDLRRDAARMVEGSEIVQASTIMLPQAMLGDFGAVEHGLGAYRPGLRLVDRAPAFDVIHVVPAISAVMLERWDMLEAPVARMEHCAARGSKLAVALLAAIDEERAAASSGGTLPEHRRLQALGYLGISELLRYRTPRGMAAAA